MKKGIILLCFILFVCTLVGCEQKEENKNSMLPAGQEDFYYEGTKETDQYIVTEEGILYSIQSVQQGDNYVQQVSVYDLEGNCVEQKILEEASSVLALEEQDGILYAMFYKTLCSIDTTTWEVKELYSFNNFSSIENMFLLGEYCYILGNLSNPPAKDYVVTDPNMIYEYHGEAIARVNVKAEEKVLEGMQIDFPILMSKRSEDSMIIYCFDEEQGFIFLEFVPSVGTITQVGKKETTAPLSELIPCENGFLFFKNSVLHYGTLDGIEAELFAGFTFVVSKPIYEQGFLFIKNSEENIKRIYLADYLHENQTIKVLMPTDMNFNPDKPYGCGYLIKETEVSFEEYALKVLAQDTDFDLYILSSRDNYSYNLKKNGAFLPLNEVEGVQEYLDACFPYVKELATNEEGDIWMLPVALAIPGMVYNKEYCEEKSVDFTQMDFAEFLQFTEKIEQTSPEETAISFFTAREELLGQYLETYDTFDTQTFREYAKLFREIYERAEEQWKLGYIELTEDGEKPDFYYNYQVYRYTLLQYAEQLGNSKEIGVMGVPAIEGCAGNIGTITYLAVNPKSDNLEATLDYITTLTSYLMEQKNSLILADKSTYTDTPFMNDLYELYANGTIRFDMDSNVYLESFASYLEGQKELEEMIAEIERRRLIYIGE